MRPTQLTREERLEAIRLGADENNARIAAKRLADLFGFESEELDTSFIDDDWSPPVTEEELDGRNWYSAEA